MSFVITTLVYTKMANSLEAAFNRQLKKLFPEDDDNSDEDFEEELASLQITAGHRTNVR